MNLYKEQLLDHYKNPRNAGTLQHPDFSSGVINPSCGDSIMIQGTIRNDAIDSLVFTGKGCVISQATASLLTEFAKGKSITELVELSTNDILNLIAIPLGPLRIQCALLSLDALKKGLIAYQQSDSHAQ